MNDEERQARNVFERLINETRRLASSAEDQTAYLDEIKTGVDEMRIGFLDVGSDLFPLYKEFFLIDQLDEEAVLAVERHLNVGLGNREHYQEFFYSWASSKNLSFWVETRSLAKNALDVLMRPQSERAVDPK
jgi:hypothetical protein